MEKTHKSRSKKINLSSVLLSFAQQTQINRSVLIEAINDTFKKAYRHAIIKKHSEIYTHTNELLLSDIKTKTVFDDKKNRLRFYVTKTVMSRVHQPHKQIKFIDAVKLDPNAKLKNDIDVEIFVDDFATPEVLQFRQVLKQKLHDISVEKIYNDFIALKGQAVMATVENVYPTYAFVSINEYSCFLPKAAWIPNEELTIGKRIIVYISDVLQKSPGSQVIVSRRANELLFAILRREVVEYDKGILSIVNFVRQPGNRSVLVIKSNEPNIEPVGSFLGVNSERIKAVSSLLSDEKIEIVKYDEDLKQYIMNLLYPARVVGFKIGPNDLKEKEAELQAEKNSQNPDDTRNRTFRIFKYKADVVVRNEDLYLAIGKKGQTVRFASNLADCNINVIMESKALEEHLDFTRVSDKDYEESMEKSVSTRKNATGLESTDTEDNESLLEWKIAFHEYETEE